MNQNQLFDKLRQKHNEFCFFSEKNLTLSKIGVHVQCMSVFLSFILVYVFISVLIIRFLLTAISTDNFNFFFD